MNKLKSFSERITTGGKNIFQQVIGPTTPRLAATPEKDIKRFNRQIAQAKKYNPWVSDMRISEIIDKARARKSLTGREKNVLHAGWPHLWLRNGVRNPKSVGLEIPNLFPENIQAAGREKKAGGGARGG